MIELTCKTIGKLATLLKKYSKVYEHATKERQPSTLYVNYLNAKGADGMTYCTPSSIATHVNQKAYDAVRCFNPGIYLMDCPGTGLVKAIVRRIRV